MNTEITGWVSALCAGSVDDIHRIDSGPWREVMIREGSKSSRTIWRIRLGMTVVVANAISSSIRRFARISDGAEKAVNCGRLKTKK